MHVRRLFLDHLLEPHYKVGSGAPWKRITIIRRLLHYLNIEASLSLTTTSPFMNGIGILKSKFLSRKPFQVLQSRKEG